ncbi:MAG: DUF1566 domain-containing protein [Alphaproteobacteria bacterium]
MALLLFSTTSTQAAEKQIGNPCTSDRNSADWDTIAQCDGTAFIRAPLMIGAVVNPPYASTACDGGKAGMVQYTGGGIQLCNGTAWAALAASGGAGGTAPFALEAKTADESVSSTTLQNDDHLKFTLSANESRWFTGVLYLSSADATSDFKAAFTVPSGATGQWHLIANGTGQTNVTSVTQSHSATITGQLTAGSVGTGTIGALALSISGYVVNAATQGDIQLQWAANGAGTSTLLKGSHMLFIGSGGGAPCNDTTPQPFFFTDLANQTVNITIYSDILQLTGFNCAVNVAVSGTGSPYFRVCSSSNSTACDSTPVQDWTPAGTMGSILSGQYLQLKLASSPTGAVTNTASVSAGNTSDNWSVGTAGDCDGSPAPGTLCADGTVYAGLSSAPGAPKMYVTRCDGGRSWDGSACSGSRATYTWNNGTSNWSATGDVCGVSANDGEAVTGCIAAITDSGNGAPHAAAQFCDGLDMHGHADWYLPSRSELDTLRINRAAIGDFRSDTVPDGNNGYWSSTEVIYDRALMQWFSDGDQDGDFKANVWFVRCARR